MSSRSSLLDLDTYAQKLAVKPEFEVNNSLVVCLITLHFLLFGNNGILCLSLQLPSVSNVQVEPIVVNIDKLDLVLVEKDDSENLSPSR